MQIKVKTLTGREIAIVRGPFGPGAAARDASHGAAPLETEM